MSYILDALRRAEAERERGQVPGLHAQPLAPALAPRALGSRRWLWPLSLLILALVAGLVVLLGGGWRSGGDRAQMPTQAPTQAPTQTPTQTPTHTSPAPAPTAPPVTARAEPTAPAPSVRPPPPVAVVAAPGNGPVVDDATGPARVAAVAPATAPARVNAPPAPSKSTEDRIPRLAELPESLRQALPKLTISGSIYSEDAAARFVMINGDVAREGAVLGPDLVLEQIRPRELVLRFRGQRYLQPV